MKIAKHLLWASVLLSSAAFAEEKYDVVKRFKILDDKLKTERMLTPIGHDFFLDINATLNTNITDFVDDVKKAADSKDSDQASEVLNKYNDTEQTLKINANLGFPLPSFGAFGGRMTPNFRVLTDVMANFGINKKELTNAELLDLFKEDLPEDLKNFILGIDLSAHMGKDLRDACTDAAGSGTTLEQLCEQYVPVGKYKIPNGGVTDPTIDAYAKVDVKAGFFNQWQDEKHFFGEWNLYALGRMDYFQYVTGSQIASGEKIETPDELNTEVTAQTDLKVGYKNANYSIFAAVEEIKLAQVKERKAASKELKYEYDPLMRVHAEALFRNYYLSIKPFAGVHKRSGYGFSDGWYLGSDFAGHVWSDRLGIQFRAMVDNSYFTLSPRIKLWIMQFEYNFKKPVKDKIDDVKLSTLHSIDVRFFF